MISEGRAMDESSRYIRPESRDGVTVVRFVDIQIGPDAKDSLYGLADGGGHERLLIDLSNIEGLSTQALGMLMMLQKKVRTAGGRMKLCGLNPEMRQLFRMTKADQVFEIHPTEEEALRAF
jgi:anti-sigma B factor antagonist